MRRLAAGMTAGLPAATAAPAASVIMAARMIDPKKGEESLASERAADVRRLPPNHHGDMAVAAGDPLEEARLPGRSACVIWDGQAMKAPTP